MEVTPFDITLNESLVISQGTLMISVTKSSIFHVSGLRTLYSTVKLHLPSSNRYIQSLHTHHHNLKASLNLDSEPLVEIFLFEAGLFSICSPSFFLLPPHPKLCSKKRAPDLPKAFLIRFCQVNSHSRTLFHISIQFILHTIFFASNLFPLIPIHQQSTSSKIKDQKRDIKKKGSHRSRKVTCRAKNKPFSSIRILFFGAQNIRFDSRREPLRRA